MLVLQGLGLNPDRGPFLRESLGFNLAKNLGFKLYLVKSLGFRVYLVKSLGFRVYLVKSLGFRVSLAKSFGFSRDAQKIRKFEHLQKSIFYRLAGGRGKVGPP